jgi:hypothetical protein
MGKNKKKKNQTQNTPVEEEVKKVDSSVGDDKPMEP